MSRMSVLWVVVSVVLALAQAIQAQQPLQVTVDVNSVWIRAGQSPVLQYRYDAVPFKPYVKELYTPGGLNVLLDAPSDHLHHHALMYAVAVDGVNFWEETPGSGHQRHGGLADMRIGESGGGPGAAFTESVYWMAAPDRPCSLSENRTIEVCRVPQLNATVVTWQSELGGQKVTLSGAHYFGLGMRFVRAMDGGQFFNADGKEGTVFRGEERHVQSNWCAYTAAIDAKPVTVAMLGHPDNPRHPTMWFTMAKPFAYLSGTLNLHEQPLTVPAGQPLVLRYAVVAWDGKVDAKQIDQAYQWYVKDYRRIHKPMEGANQDEKRK